MSGRRFQSTDDYTPTLWCPPHRLSGNRSESFQFFHTARTRHHNVHVYPLSHLSLSQHISDVGTTQSVFILSVP